MIKKLAIVILLGWGLPTMGMTLMLPINAKDQQKIDSKKAAIKALTDFFPNRNILALVCAYANPIIPVVIQDPEHPVRYFGKPKLYWLETKTETKPALALDVYSERSNGEGIDLLRTIFHRRRVTSARPAGDQLRIYIIDPDTGMLIRRDEDPNNYENNECGLERYDKADPKLVQTQYHGPCQILPPNTQYSLPPLCPMTCHLEISEYNQSKNAPGFQGHVVKLSGIQGYFFKSEDEAAYTLCEHFTPHVLQAPQDSKSENKNS